MGIYPDLSRTESSLWWFGNALGPLFVNVLLALLTKKDFIPFYAIEVLTNLCHGLIVSTYMWYLLRKKEHQNEEKRKRVWRDVEKQLLGGGRDSITLVLTRQLVKKLISDDEVGALLEEASKAGNDS